jgi:hypothetical protein
MNDHTLESKEMENNKEEMVMTPLKRRATNDSIKHTRSNSEV